MSSEELEVGFANEEYVIEKYLTDDQTPENLIERIVIVNDEIVEHWKKEGVE
jgi:hypothetical protein